MSGLVEEIQALALDPTVKISDLLRRVKLAAVKLKLQDTVDWVDQELKGYGDAPNLPDYRMTTGQLKAHTPYHGVIPVVGKADWIDEVCSGRIADSIAKVELLAGDGSNEVISGVHGAATEAMNKSHGTPGTQYYVHIPQTIFSDILDQVRNLVLEWACTLEQQDILGEGISFTVEEKQKAEQAAQQITINYGHIHHGDVSGSQNKTVIDSTDNSTNTISTENVFQQVIDAVNSSIGNENDRKEIVELVEAMQSAQGTADYKPLFQKWVGYLADYATVLGPFLPAFSNLAG